MVLRCTFNYPVAPDTFTEMVHLEWKLILILTHTSQLISRLQFGGTNRGYNYMLYRYCDSTAHDRSVLSLRVGLLQTQISNELCAL